MIAIRNLSIWFILFSCVTSSTFAGTATPASASVTSPRFADFFQDRIMRIDYFHIADKNSEQFTIDKIYRQGTWAGNPDSLIDPFDNGRYYIKVYDHSTVKEKTDRLIYSYGFNSYCGEYKTTDMAAKGIKRTYHETALIPFPKEKIKFTIEWRDRKNKLKPVFTQIIDPTSVDVIAESLSDGVTVIEVLNSGNPHKKVDLAFIAEGYTREELGKFKSDLQDIIQLVFTYEPYKSLKGNFNIYGVFKASKESGTDEPTLGIFKNTAVGTTFNSLYLRRYNLTEENRVLRDIAAHVPYDALNVVVNHKRYGGGGIYNSFCIFTLNEAKYAYLFLHEFGHSFAGLADEYYAGSVAYNEFYPSGVEPTEPNITALIDPAKLKWKEQVSESTKLPTPWEKEAHDKMGKIEKTRHRAKEEYKGVVGAFEGAGYSSKGLYRSMVNCLMYTSELQPYCKVCETAIVNVIKHYIR